MKRLARAMSVLLLLASAAALSSGEAAAFASRLRTIAPPPQGVDYPPGLDSPTARRRYELILFEYGAAQDEILNAWDETLPERQRLEQRIDAAILDSSLAYAECNRTYQPAAVGNPPLQLYYACLCLAQWQATVNGISKMLADESFDTFISAAYQARQTFFERTADLAPDPQVRLDDDIPIVEEQRILYQARIDLALKLMTDAGRMTKAYVEYEEATYIEPMRQAVKEIGERVPCGFQLSSGQDAVCTVLTGRGASGAE